MQFHMSNLASSPFIHQMASPAGEPPLVRTCQPDTHQVAELHRKRPKIAVSSALHTQQGDTDRPAARETFSMSFLGMDGNTWCW